MPPRILTDQRKDIRITFSWDIWCTAICRCAIQVTCDSLFGETFSYLPCIKISVSRFELQWSTPRARRSCVTVLFFKHTLDPSCKDDLSISCETQRASDSIHMLGVLLIFSCDDTFLQLHGWTFINIVKEWNLVWIYEAYLMISCSPQEYRSVLANTDVLLRPL